MNELYPIVRRKRKPLLPEEPVHVTPAEATVPPTSENHDANNQKSISKSDTQRIQTGDAKRVP